MLRVPRVGPVDFMKHYMKSDDFVVLDTRNVCYLVYLRKFESLEVPCLSRQ